MKNNSNRLAVKMLIAMVAGIAVGLGFMLLREKLGADSAAWTAINDLLFQDITDKGAVIELEGDADAFCFNRELAKEDGSMPVAGETLAFKVVELRKAAKKATLSHAKTYAAAVEARVAAATAEADNTKRAVKKINSSVEKTTLGDIDALAALKDQLEGK